MLNSGSEGDIAQSCIEYLKSWSRTYIRERCWDVGLACRKAGWRSPYGVLSLIGDQLKGRSVRLDPKRVNWRQQDG